MGEFLKEKTLFNVVDRNAENIFWVDQYISGVVGVDAIYESKRIVESDLPNFGNYDTTFTGNRILSGAGLNLTFDNIGTFTVDGTTKVISPSASGLDTAFSVRNNTDISSLFQVLGNGNILGKNLNNSSNTFYVSQRTGNTVFDIDTQGASSRLNLLALAGTYQQGAIQGNNGLVFYTEGAVDGGTMSGAFQGGKFGLKPFLKASLPSAGNAHGNSVIAGLILVTDAVPRPTICYSNGTNWIDLQTGVTVV